MGDIIFAVHARAIPNVRQLAFNLCSYAVCDQAEIEVSRAEERLTFHVSVLERAVGTERFNDLLQGGDSPLSRLGVLTITVDDEVSALLPPVRLPGGVLVAANMADVSLGWEIY